VNRLIAGLRHMTGTWGASPAQVVVRSVPRLLVMARLRAGLLFRASSWCWHYRLFPSALWLQDRTNRSVGAEIHPAAEIGSGL